MLAAARGNGVDTVWSVSGIGNACRFPTTTVTGAGSSTVFINGSPAIRIGDPVGSHNKTGCVPDDGVLTLGSLTVFINGQAAGRIGDQYAQPSANFSVLDEQGNNLTDEQGNSLQTEDYDYNTITSGSPNVFFA